MLAIWARRMDKKDRAKLGTIALDSNDPFDKYLYEVLVVTGSRNGAGTKSKVLHFNTLCVCSLQTAHHVTEIQNAAGHYGKFNLSQCCLVLVFCNI